MEIRLSQTSDIPMIMNIIKQAQQQLKSYGVNQWQNNYPNELTFLNDIQNNQSYVVIINDQIMGTFALSDYEKTYNKIYEGNWLSTQAYAVIHRIALDNQVRGRGLFAEIISNITELCAHKQIFSIKIDTHPDNKIMRKSLERSGFTYCGIIYLLDGNLRIAYEKLLK